LFSIKPLTAMTLIAGSSLCNARIVAGPSMKGIIISVTTTLIAP